MLGLGRDSPSSVQFLRHDFPIILKKSNSVYHLKGQSDTALSYFNPDTSIQKILVVDVLFELRSVSSLQLIMTMIDRKEINIGFNFMDRSKQERTKYFRWALS